MLGSSVFIVLVGKESRKFLLTPPKDLFICYSPILGAAIDGQFSKAESCGGYARGRPRGIPVLRTVAVKC